MTHTLIRTRIAVLVLAVLLAACGSPSSSPTASTSPASSPTAASAGGAANCTTPTKITYRLNWTLDYEQVPFFAAKDKGFYSAQCLDVTIQPGRGSADTTTIVGSGTAQIGIADAVAIMQGQAKGLPLTGTAVAWRSNAFAVVVRTAALKGKTDPQPQDLYGLTFGAVTTGSPYIFWKAFVNQQKLDKSKIKEVSIAPPGYAEMASGKVDFLANFASAQGDLESKGVPVTLLKAANFGQQGYGLSIFANSDWLKDHGDDMKRFLTATAQGMAWSANNPEEALAMEAKVNPALTSDPKATAANLKGFRTDASLWASDAPLGKGTYLTFDEAGLKSTQKILYDGGVLTGTPFDVNKYWTSQYVPAPSTYQQYQKAGQ